MAIGDECVEAVKNWKTPTTTKEIEKFLGFANYHRTFIKDYAKMATSLNRLTGKKPYVWGQEQQDAFDSLKLALITTPVLALPNSKDLFILDTDASDFAIGAGLIQVQEGKERVLLMVVLVSPQSNNAIVQQERSYSQLYVSPNNSIIICWADNLWLGLTIAV